MNLVQIKILPFLMLFAISACSDENPTITETGDGKVIIESNVEKGEIFRNGEFTGLFTPDTLELLAVNHNIKVRKDGFFSEERAVTFKKNEILIENFNLIKNNLERTILLESFIQSKCDTCNLSTDKIQKLREKFNRIQFINYTPNISSNNIGEVNERLDFYNIIDSENFIIDGTISKSYENQIVSRFLKNTIFSISIGDTIAHGDNLTLTFFVDVFDLDGYDFNDLYLFTALTEDDVNLSLNGNLKNYDSVLRKFLDGSNGISLRGINKKGRARFANSSTLDPKWNKEKLNIICFVQNSFTKEIIQVGSSKILFQ